VHLIYGINSVAEALKARGRAFEYVTVAKERHDLRLQGVIEECRRIGLPVRFASRADVITSKKGVYSLLLILDGVEDPHNLGAIIRTADAAGVDGLIIPERRAAGVSGTVTKVSAGASAHLPIAKVTNISRTLQDMKQQNIWIVGLDERAASTYDTLDFNMDCALVLGAEGKGVHELVRKNCDFLVSIPMLGQVSSLNVSVAAGVVLYEIVRQRRVKGAVRVSP
jgi:23S rRNA (guanosine2251-2'-O)-methyltransferase